MVAIIGVKKLPTLAVRSKEKLTKKGVESMVEQYLAEQISFGIGRIIMYKGGHRAIVVLTPQDLLEDYDRISW